MSGEDVMITGVRGVSSEGECKGRREAGVCTLVTLRLLFLTYPEVTDDG